MYCSSDSQQIFVHKSIYWMDLPCYPIVGSNHCPWFKRSNVQTTGPWFKRSDFKVRSSNRVRGARIRLHTSKVYVVRSSSFLLQFGCMRLGTATWHLPIRLYHSPIAGRPWYVLVEHYQHFSRIRRFRAPTSRVPTS